MNRVREQIGLKVTGSRLRAPAANGEPYDHPLNMPHVRKKAESKNAGVDKDGKEE